MNKIFTSLFAMSAIFCASAAVPTFTVNPVDSTVLESKTQEVTFTFSEEVTVTEIGFASGPLNQRQFNVVKESQTGTTIKAQILEEYWGKPQDGVIAMQVSCSNVLNAQGDTIKNDDGYPAQFLVNYTIKETSAGAEFLSVWPAEGEYSAAEMYGTGADFYFSDEVEMTNENATARIAYFVNGERVATQAVPALDVWGDWDWWTNNYVLSVPIPEVEEVTDPATLSSIEITLTGIQSGGVNVTVPKVTYDSAASPTRNIKKANQSKINSVGVAAQTTANVYSIQGALVKENADLNNLNLPKGIYVVNGRKIIVR